MNAEIQRTRRQIEQLLADQRAYLTGKPKEFLRDLQHEAESLRNDESGFTRIAAEINRSACVLALEPPLAFSATDFSTTKHTNHTK